MKEFLKAIWITITSPLGLIVLFLAGVWYYLHIEGIENKEKEFYFVNETKYLGIIKLKRLTIAKKSGVLVFHDFYVKDTLSFLNIFHSNEYQGLYDYATIGDTIIKVKGKGRITIKKPTGEEKDFEYNSRILPDVE